jgi:hypothetical protein
MRRLEAEDSDVPGNELIELVLRDVGLEYIPKRSMRVQKYYMRRGLHMGLNTSVQQLVERQRLNDPVTCCIFLKKTQAVRIKMKSLKF